MKYTVKPEEYQFRKVKEQVEEVLETYSYCIEIEDFSVNIGWQNFNQSISFINTDSSINLIINPEKELEGLEKALMRAVFHLEFRKRSVYDNIEFSWQEIGKFGYAFVRERNTIGVEEGEEELGDMWPELKQRIEGEDEDFDEILYRNTGALGKAIAVYLTEEKGFEPEDFLDLKRTDIIEAGDQVFG